MERSPIDSEDPKAKLRDTLTSIHDPAPYVLGKIFRVVHLLLCSMESPTLRTNIKNTYDGREHWQAPVY
jgi:hypothetical protein